MTFSICVYACLCACLSLCLSVCVCQSDLLSPTNQLTWVVLHTFKKLNMNFYFTWWPFLRFDLWPQKVIIFYIGLNFTDKNKVWHGWYKICLGTLTWTFISFDDLFWDLTFDLERSSIFYLGWNFIAKTRLQVFSTKFYILFRSLFSSYPHG